MNLGGNNISSIPNEIVEMKKLRILFFAGNKFDIVPECLGQMSSLYMLSFKSNSLINVPEASLSPSIGWLILTDNKLTKLPNSIGNCIHMKKLMLANNRLVELPFSLSNCKKLELLRISCNRLTELPSWIYEFPSLAWIATSNNDFSYKSDLIYSMNDIVNHTSKPFIRLMNYDNLLIQGKIGEGASGYVYHVTAKDTQQQYALKLFKSAVTSDGIPYDEVMINCLVGTHPNILCCQYQILEIMNHVQSVITLEDIRLGLLFPLLSDTCVPLAGPPSFHTVTRDVYNPHPGIQYSLSFILRILHGIASACTHLHSLGIAHGDIYGHNILIYPDGTPMLVDFGAATIYDPDRYAQSHVDHVFHSVTASSYSDVLILDLEYIEVVAYGVLISELMALISIPLVVENEEMDRMAMGNGVNDDTELVLMLRQVYDKCNKIGIDRIRFRSISNAINKV